MKLKKLFKVIIGVIIFFTLPSLLLFGFLYFKYNEDLPQGTTGVEADALAHKMLKALNFEAYKNTANFEWTFKQRHHYKWNKTTNECAVLWQEYKVVLNLNNPKKHTAYVHSFKVDGDLANDLIEKAVKYYNNDSFWVFAPYKVFDEGVQRKLVTLPNNEKGLLVTYTTGGSTPGDSYLWMLDTNYKPKAFKMWTSILPIDGLEASWADWTTTQSGAQVPTFHKLLFLGIEITDIEGVK